MYAARLLILFLFLGLNLKSQQLLPLNEAPFLDSLNTSLNRKIPDSAKANSYFLLSDYYRTISPEKSQEYLQKGRSFAKTNSTALAKYHFYSAMLLSAKNPALAEANFNNAEHILEHKKDVQSLNLLSSIYYNAALLNKNKKGYPYLVKVLTEKSIPAAEKVGDQRKIGHLYAQLGNILTYNAEFPKAETYLAKARNILQKAAPQSPELLFAYLNSCMNFCYQSNGTRAREMLMNAENIIKNYPESTNYPLYLYNKMLYEITMQQVPNALKTADLGIAKSTAKKQNMLLQMFYFNKYDLLRKSGKLPAAKEILLNILHDKTLVHDAANRRTVYKELSTLAEQMGDDGDALLWSRQYALLSDSLNESKMKLEINDLETKFRTTEKEKLLAEKNLEINRKTSLVWLFLGTTLLFLMGGLFAYFYFKNKKKLTEQREINLAQKLADQEKSQELLVTKAIMEAEERERYRVAKDLHDGVGGMIAGAKINLSSWAAHREAMLDESLSKIIGQLDGSANELRRVARNLMPENLLNSGLETALRDLCDYYSRADLHIDFQSINISEKLPVNSKINIYRIVQELLSNAVKHAGAKNILVQCAQNGTQFQITVEDDGVGFISADTVKTESMGMKNIQSRVEFLKGKMDIQSHKNQGTTVNIELNTNAS